MGLLKIGGILGKSLYMSIAYGWLTFRFYYWFILPTFTTLPHITFPQSIGLYLFIGLFKVTPIRAELDIPFEKKKDLETLNFFYPWAILGIAYLIKIILIK